MEVSAPAATLDVGPLDVARIKKDFPILERTVHGKRLVYLDSASSAQKPLQVIDTMDRYYTTTHANVHRGVYQIAQEATALYESARAKVAAFVGAASAEEIVFTKNATEAVNLVAYSWGRANLGPHDTIVTSEIEHHANLVPWLQLHGETGTDLRFLPFRPDGGLDLDDLAQLLDGAKLLAVTAASNVLGTLPPVRLLADAAHAAGALVLVDGAQYVPHLPTDVQQLGADFVAFTGHKMLGPTGIGTLWARRELLDAMPPFMTGGEMIRDVRLDGFTTNDVPWKFEAGTPPIAEAIGLGAAVDYLQGLGMAAVRSHEQALTAYAMQALSERYGSNITMHGPKSSAQRSGIVSFTYKDVHAHDLSQVLDEAGVCVRAGHHCAKPLMRRLGVSATARASFSVYNDEADVDALVDAIGRADALFG
jgi:cysteine desulfurase/selenocysteine lyase